MTNDDDGPLPLVSCSGPKLGVPAPARDLYTRRLGGAHLAVLAGAEQGARHGGMMELYDKMVGLLNAHHEGVITRNAVVADVTRHVLDELIAFAEKEKASGGDGLFFVSSYCGMPPPPPKVARLELEVGVSCVKVVLLP